MKTTDEQIKTVEKMAADLFQVCTIEGSGWTGEEQDQYDALTAILAELRESQMSNEQQNEREAAVPVGAILFQPAPSHSPDQVCSGCCRCICHGVSWKPCSTCKPYHWQRELRERDRRMTDLEKRAKAWDEFSGESMEWTVSNTFNTAYALGVRDGAASVDRVEILKKFEKVKESIITHIQVHDSCHDHACPTHQKLESALAEMDAVIEAMEKGNDL